MKKIKRLLCLSLCFALIILNAQSQKRNVVNSENDTTVYLMPEKLASFPGGDRARSMFIAQTIEYPLDARNRKETGKIFASFIIEKDGSISNVRVLRGASKSLNNEAIRVIRSMPKWIPASQSGKTVRSRFNLPVKFLLGHPKDLGLEQSRKQKRAIRKMEESIRKEIKGAEFPGGPLAMILFIKENTRYPKQARKDKISGNVKVQFYIDVDGSVIDLSIRNGVSDELDQEALRVISSMPKWKPATKKDKPFKALMVVPVKFKLK